MTQRSSPVETSMLYPTRHAPIDQIDVTALRTLLTMLGVTPNDIRRQNSDYILIDCMAFEAVIVGCDVAFPEDHFDGAEYPGADTPVGKTIRADLAQHQSSLTVIVVDKHSSSALIPDAELMRRVGWHMLYLLMEMTRPELVFWCETDRLLTPQMATEAIKEFHRANPFSYATPFGAAAMQEAPVSGDTTEHPQANPLPQFTPEPILSSDVLAWFHKPKAGLAEADDKPQASLPGVGEWLRRMSHTSRATIGLSMATTTLGLFSLPIKASAALGKLF